MTRSHRATAAWLGAWCSLAAGCAASTSLRWDGSGPAEGETKYVALTSGLPAGARQGPRGDLDPETCRFVCGDAPRTDLVGCGFEPTPPDLTVGCHTGDRHLYIPVSPSFEPQFRANLYRCNDVCAYAGEGRHACGLQPGVPTRWGPSVACHYRFTTGGAR